jgi:hypothetical protein
MHGSSQCEPCEPGVIVWLSARYGNPKLFAIKFGSHLTEIGIVAKRNATLKVACKSNYDIRSVLSDNATTCRHRFPKNRPPNEEYACAVPPEYYRKSDVALVDQIMCETHIPSRLKPGNLTVKTYVEGNVSMAIQQSSDAGALLRNGSYGSSGRPFPPGPCDGGEPGGVRMVGGAGGGGYIVDTRCDRSG